MSNRPVHHPAADPTGPLVRTTDAARKVRFDRPLVEQPGWADPRIDRQVAEAARAAREQGLAQGYAAGWAQGRRAAAEREAADTAERARREEADRRLLAVRVQQMTAALAAAGRTLGDGVVPSWDALVDTLLDGALAIAAAAFDRELASLDSATLTAARTALRLLPASEPVTLHVNPADLDLFDGFGGTGGAGATGATGGAGAAGGASGDGAPAMEDVAGLRLEADETVAVGTVVARTPLHTLPVDLRAALRAAEEVIRP